MTDRNRSPQQNSAIWTVLAVCAAVVIAGLIYSTSKINETASTTSGTTTGQSTSPGPKTDGGMAPGPPQQPPR
jgi:hypothetical protein